MPIPNPPDWRIEFASSDLGEANKVMNYFRIDLLESGVVENIDTNINNNSKYLIKPFVEFFQKMRKLNYKLQVEDLGNIISLTNKPVGVARLTINAREKQIVMMYPEREFIEDSALKSLPISVGDKVIPLRALAEFELLKADQFLFRLNGENTIRLEGRFTEKEKKRE